MAGCSHLCSCVSAEPLEADEMVGMRGQQLARFNENRGRFRVAMADTPCGVDANTTCCCLMASVPLTWSCVQVHMRYKALNHLEPGSGWSNYVCCQGYVPACLCFAPGHCGERELPRTCAFLETCCCPGLAVTSTRFLLFDHYDLAPDPCDNKLIRISNCVQLLACICDIAAHFDRNLRELSAILDLVADLVFLALAGCMTAQIDHEMAYRSRTLSSSNNVPTAYDALSTTIPTADAVELVKTEENDTPLQPQTIER